MTIDGLVEDLPGGERPTGSEAALRVDQVIGICDRLLGELARREHRFGWLRAPEGAADAWLAVDAYYPGNRLVLRWRTTPTELDAVFERLVPEHGLRLLQVGPHDVGADPLPAGDALARLISALGPAPERARAVAAAAPAVGPATRRGASQAEAAQRARRLAAARAAAGGRRPARPVLPLQAQAAAPRAAIQPIGLPATLLLTAVAIAEVWVGVMRLGLDRGRIALGLGFALDACARALGTVAAERGGAGGWSAACAVGGSPFVAAFALYQRGGPVRTEPAPLAGMVGVVACSVLGLALAASALGL